MSTPDKQTIAVFGATGGCAAATLATALRAGHHCTALVRTPSKLTQILTAEPHSLETSLLDTHLTIHEGNIKDVSAVSKALISPRSPKQLVDIIMYGVGSLPTLRFALNPVTLQDPTLCETGMSTVLAALGQLESEGVQGAADGRKPLVIAISTTGTQNKSRDVPWAYYIFYHWLLAVPHADKRRMEELLYKDNGAHVRDYVVIKPTLLDDEKKGVAAVRSGWEWGDINKREGEPGPALGYWIGRVDVGTWIYEKVIKEGGWEGKVASLTY